jgi:hypothetical protein
MKVLNESKLIHRMLRRTYLISNLGIDFLAEKDMIEFSEHFVIKVNE